MSCEKRAESTGTRWRVLYGCQHCESAMVLESFISDDIEVKFTFGVGINITTKSARCRSKHNREEVGSEKLLTSSKGGGP